MEAKLEYLKEHLSTNIPLPVVIMKRVGQYPETDFSTKQPTGRMQTLYNFQLPTGQIVRHYAKEREEDVLQHFHTGETVQVVRQESNRDGKLIHFLVWTPKDGAEARAAANPQPMTNSRQTATQRDLKDREEEREQKDIQICLQGFMQAFVASGTDAKSTDQLVEAALAFAEKAREAIIKRSAEIRIGVGPMSHPPAQLKAAEDTFGVDPTMPPPDSMEDFQ